MRHTYDNKFDVYDFESGKNYDVTIKNQGKTAEVFDWREGEYKDYDLRRGINDKIEIYDWETGKEFEFSSRNKLGAIADD